MLIPMLLYCYDKTTKDYLFPFCLVIFTASCLLNIIFVNNINILYQGATNSLIFNNKTITIDYKNVENIMTSFNNIGICPNNISYVEPTFDIMSIAVPCSVVIHNNIFTTIIIKYMFFAFIHMTFALNK
jgi:hypothetical protein